MATAEKTGRLTNNIIMSAMTLDAPTGFYASINGYFRIGWDNNLPNKTPPESDQDAFNRVWQYFIINKAPQCRLPYDPAKPSAVRKCMNRYEGNGCAVGCMLPDDLANKCDNMVGASIRSTWRYVRGYFKKVNLELLEDLQYAHDSYFDELEKNLRSIAEFHQLGIPNL